MEVDDGDDAWNEWESIAMDESDIDMNFSQSIFSASQSDYLLIRLHPFPYLQFKFFSTHLLSLFAHDIIRNYIQQHSSTTN